MRYLTKDWFLKCQVYPQTKEIKEELYSIANAYRAAQEKEDLPCDTLERFMFHDGRVLKTETGKDFTIEVNSPFSPHGKIIFCDAVIKQELPPIGATWLNQELYRHKSGVGYEAHILFIKMMTPSHKNVMSSDLFETKIICKDILFE